MKFLELCDQWGEGGEIQPCVLLRALLNNKKRSRTVTIQAQDRIWVIWMRLKDRLEITFGSSNCRTCYLRHRLLLTSSTSQRQILKSLELRVVGRRSWCLLGLPILGSWDTR